MYYYYYDIIIIIIITVSAHIISLRCCRVRKVKVLVAQSCPTLCDPMDRSPPGSSIYGILQARISAWVAISFSKGSSQPGE